MKNKHRSSIISFCHILQKSFIFHLIISGAILYLALWIIFHFANGGMVSAELTEVRSVNFIGSSFQVREEGGFDVVAVEGLSLKFKDKFVIKVDDAIYDNVDKIQIKANPFSKVKISNQEAPLGISYLPVRNEVFRCSMDYNESLMNDDYFELALFGSRPDAVEVVRRGMAITARGCIIGCEL